MASITITKSSLFLIAAAITKLVSADTVLAFPAAGCDQAGYYQEISADQDTCTKTYLSDDDFQLAGNSSGEYQAWFSLKTELADGCALVIGSSSPDAKDPPCGECAVFLHTFGDCYMTDLPTPFYAWTCCGDACQTQCAETPGRRSIGEAAEALEVRKAKANPTSPDIANLKNRSPISSAPKAKRSDCSFTGAGDKYSQAGSPYKVTNTVTDCKNEDGCSVSYAGTIESSFSQTFGVSESTEAGLFDVVSETVSFDYSATWEESKSVQVSGMFTFSEGQSGYVNFSPTSQCIDGTFAGADCGGMGIPTGGDARSACVPKVIAGQQPDGDLSVVSVD